jgi:hypothetical protein
MKPSLATFIAGCGLLIPASLGLLMSRVPVALGPFPALTTLPALVFSRAFAVGVPSLLFFLWNPGLFRGDSEIPRRSLGLLVVATVLSIIWFVVGWSHGVRYQGAGYVYKVSLANVAWLACLLAAFVRFRKNKSSFGLNLALHWLLFAWFAWYAFPYLGELP